MSSRSLRFTVTVPLRSDTVNYVYGGVGKTTVETVVYFNGIQNSMKCPKYLQDKELDYYSSLVKSSLKSCVRKIVSPGV